jgi:hypothetical protein
MDVLGQFLAECCTIQLPRSEVKTQSAVLYKAYCDYAGDNLTQTMFSLALKERGFTTTGTKGGSVANFDFGAKSENRVSTILMTYRPPNSRKSNFATEPIEDLSSFITLTVHFLLTAPGTPICSVPTGALTEREPSA